MLSNKPVDEEVVGVGAMDVVGAVEIDRALRSLARRRAGLDVEEARWIRIAEEQRAWAELGFVHAHEYLEEVFGYAPRTATERLRVAHELGDLPALEGALEAGEINYSIVRELTRVATPETVDRWLSAARGKNLRDVERMVSGRCKGDDPESKPDPKLVKHGVWLDLDAETFALFRQARAELEDEMGEKLDDKSFINEVARRMLSPAAPGAANHPARMIHIMTCSECRRSWQDGAGVRVELDAAADELAQCDAIIVDEVTGKRARSTIPLATRRRVLARAQHRCEVPGCRSSRNLDIHHLEPWSQGGGHQDWNLIALCGGHHRPHHRGQLSITGRAPEALVFERGGRRLGGRSNAGGRELGGVGSDAGERRLGGGNDAGERRLRGVGSDAGGRQLGGVGSDAGERRRTGVGSDAGGRQLGGVGSDAGERRLGGGSDAGGRQLGGVGSDAGERRLGGGNDAGGGRLGRVGSDAGGAKALASPHRRPLPANAPMVIEHVADARAALTQMGYKAGIAKRAVERACAHVGVNADLTTLLRAALRHCV